MVADDDDNDDKNNDKYDIKKEREEEDDDDDDRDEKNDDGNDRSTTNEPWSDKDDATLSLDANGKSLISQCPIPKLRYRNHPYLKLRQPPSPLSFLQLNISKSVRFQMVKVSYSHTAFF